MYDELLADVEEVRAPYVAPDREHVFHLYVIQTEKRDALRQFLNERGVATVINYSRALPFYKAYEYLGHVPEDFPNAYANQSRILSLPIFPEITEKQQVYVIDAVRQFFA